MARSNKKEWPDTDPPDKSDICWESTRLFTLNGPCYKKSEVSPGKWQWVVDEPAMKAMADSENRKQELWLALTRRAITDSELLEVARYGSCINIQMMVPYDAKQKLLELHNALLIQQMLRGSK